jgi:uncharacterized protein
MAEKVFRDPVHDVIALHLQDPIDRLLLDLISTPEVQRLRRIRQLGMATFAYSGADHSRLSHSLGVMETARRALAHLALDHHLPEEARLLLPVAAILHDIGHGPFSHVFERVSGIHHEAVTTRLILDEQSAVFRVLSDFDPHLPQKVVSILEKSPTPGGQTPSWVATLLSGQLDVDRFDYLLRDDLMTGSHYGGFDLEWLLRSLVIVQQNGVGRLAVKQKGVSAVEGYLQARYHMYRNVYFHKVVRSAEGMLRLALQRAKRLAVQGRLPLTGLDNGLHLALVGSMPPYGAFQDLDDVTILACFKVWATDVIDDPVLQRLCKGLLTRRLYKTVQLPADWSPDRVDQAVAAARTAVGGICDDVDYALFYDEPASTPYEAVDADDPAGTKDIFVAAPAGLARLTEISPFSAALSERYILRRLHVAEEFIEIVRKSVVSGA